jgi:hypothetical protein
MSLQEDSLIHASPPSRLPPARVASSPKLMLLPASPSAGVPKESSALARLAVPRLKCLTTAEMAAKCERGECYNCTEKFSCEHLNVCPMKGIYLLQMTDNDINVTDEEDDPRISLHTITDVSPVDMTQLQVRIGETLLGP